MSENLQESRLGCGLESVMSREAGRRRQKSTSASEKDPGSQGTNKRTKAQAWCYKHIPTHSVQLRLRKCSEV